MTECYNCGSTAHLSRSCSRAQKYSRCRVCNNVCVGEHSHKSICTNKDFVSKVLDTSTVIEPMNILEIGFSGIESVFVADSSIEKAVLYTPIFVSNASLLIYKNDRKRLQISSVGRPSDDDKITLSIMDKAEKVCASISIGKNSMEVNQRYKVFETGIVQFNITNDGRVALSKELNIKVVAEKPFKMTIYKFGLRIPFEVHPNGVILLDPIAGKIAEMGAQDEENLPLEPLV